MFRILNDRNHLPTQRMGYSCFIEYVRISFTKIANYSSRSIDERKDVLNYLCFTPDAIGIHAGKTKFVACLTECSLHTNKVRIKRSHHGDQIVLYSLFWHPEKQLAEL